MTWLVAFTIAFGIWITVFPLYIFTKHENKKEDKKVAIELWTEANNELLTMTYLKKLVGCYMTIQRKTFRFFGNL
ncbi:hypothetical protein IID24_05415 [Patescibacteria group bacterium]|nr:hypothetical protein [Patescibacteria group bacterium]